MARMISRQSAAGLLDCTSQTVANWVERGLINGHKIDGSLMVDRDSILQYFDSLKDLADMEQKIMDMKREMKEKTEEMKAALEELRIVVYHSDRIKWVFRENQMTLIKFYGWRLTNRERSVLERTTMGERPEVIAKELGLSRERVIQIGVKAAETICDMADFEQLVDDNSKLAIEIVKLQKVKKKLEIENENLEIENKKLNLQIEKLNEKLESAKNKPTILKKRISDLPLSNRTLNALRSLDCKTLGDVVLFEKSDLMKVRNFGKKCLFELDDYITRNGLHWGMMYESRI